MAKNEFADIMTAIALACLKYFIFNFMILKQCKNENRLLIH